MYTKVAGCPITEQTVIYAQLKRSMPELSSNLTHLQSLATSCANPEDLLVHSRQDGCCTRTAPSCRSSLMSSHEDNSLETVWSHSQTTDSTDVGSLA